MPSSSELPPLRDAEAHQAVDHDHHGDRADDRLGRRAAAAAEAVAAEHRRRQGRDLEPDAGIGARAAQARREEHAGQRGKRARHDIGEADHAPHRDADIVRGAARAADRQHMPAGPRPAEHQMRGDGDARPRRRR